MTRAILCLVISLLTGCASIFSGSTDDIHISATDGARYSITNANGTQVASGISQGTATLQRGASYFRPHSYKLKVAKAGYQPQTLDIQPSINPWYFANILIGGVVGMVIVDPLTGAMYKLYPNDINISLEPSNDPAKQPGQELPGRAESDKSPVSRHDYTGQQRAKSLGCQPISSPEVINFKSAVETLVFRCSDGRRLTMNCSSSSGCE